MLEKEAMLKDVATKAALPLIGAAFLSTAFERVYANEGPRPAVRSEMLVSTTWLEQHLNDRNLIVLYIGRDRAQFDSGHIPGSRFVRLDELVEQHKDSLNELPSVADLVATFESLGVGQRSRVVLYRRCGRRAGGSCFLYPRLPGTRGPGGAARWGLEKVESRIAKDFEGRDPVAPGEFSPHVRPDVLVSTAQMLQLSLGASKGASDYVLLDARPSAEHTGLVYSESIAQAGHIAGSQSLYWKRLIRSDVNPQMLDTTELRQRFEDAGAQSGKSVVTYCRTGMQSSFTYFVAKYLGYRAAMYDGSVYEWVRTAGNVLVISPTPQRATATHQQKHLTR